MAEWKTKKDASEFDIDTFGEWVTIEEAKSKLATLKEKLVKERVKSVKHRYMMTKYDDPKNDKIVDSRKLTSAWGYRELTDNEAYDFAKKQIDEELNEV